MEQELPAGLRTMAARAVHQVREWFDPSPSSRSTTERAWVQACAEQRTTFSIPDPERRGETSAVRVRGKDRAGFWVLERSTGERVASFATAGSCKRYLETCHLDPISKEGERLAFAPYTQIAFAKTDADASQAYYQGRPRITSISTVQGGVYLPEQLKTMEAIVVDWEKDMFLRAYLRHVTRQFVEVLRQGRDLSALEIIRGVNAHILKQFPYQQKMLEEGYAASRGWYGPNAKVMLGAIMQSQDCVCRHHALIFAATLEYMQSSGAPPELRARLQGARVRFLAEQMSTYKNEERGRTSGHAYCGISLPEQALIVDPSAELVATASELALWSAQRTSFQRYLYSLTRFCLDSAMTDTTKQELQRVAHWARSNAALRMVILDACTVARNREQANVITNSLFRKF